MYGINVGKVIIVGTRNPEWLVNVDYIHDNPNIMNYHAKIAMAYYKSSEKVTDEFVIMNDDFFLLEKTDFATFKNKERGNSLKHHLATYGTGYFYGKQIENTVNNLSTDRHFDSHYPMKLNRGKFRGLYDKFKDKIENKTTILIRSLYGNYYNIEAEILDDLKITSNYNLPVKNRFCFSIGDNGLTDKMKAYLQELYPNQSKYERI